MLEVFIKVGLRADLTSETLTMSYWPYFRNPKTQNIQDSLFGQNSSATLY